VNVPVAQALEIATAPFLHRGISTRRVMFEVVFALLPVVVMASYRFGLAALLSVTACCAGALLTERLFGSRGARSVRDGSALITGLLLALTLPPGLPLWMGLLGGAVSIGLGKLIFGGLGQNQFNPALVGRAFLQAAFPTAITTWTPPSRGFWTVDGSLLAPPLFRGEMVDAVSCATPLGMAKFEGQLTELPPLLWGNTAGSLGETSAILLIAIGLWLGMRGIFDWRLPISTLLSVAACSAAMHLLDKSHPGPLFMLSSGGLLFAVVFMVTDPVTTPITPRGAWIFGIGVGALVVLIRLFGGLPEGVMYAVLLMNAVTPLINRYTQPRPFGGVVA